MTTPLDRFWAHVTKTDGCWPWTGPLNTSGYGDVRKSRFGSRLAHRVAYTLLVGPIPPETPHLDHTCHNADPTCPGGLTCVHRRCVNPSHLEPVTNGENQRRATARSARLTCGQGHPWTPETTIHRADYGRRCRECERARDRLRKAKLRLPYAGRAA